MDVIKAIKAGDEARIRELLAESPTSARARDENGVSALLLAKYYGRNDLVELLRPAVADLDVFEAAGLGETAQLTELLDADPELVGRWSPDGFSPLQLACFFGHPDGVDLLLERGADVGAAAKNPTRLQALHSAVAAGETGAARTTVVRMATQLLECGADVNARQEGGFTPLHAAAQSGDAELARLLLDQGADPGAATDDGKSPADFAAERGHADVAVLLRG